MFWRAFASMALACSSISREYVLISLERSAIWLTSPRTDSAFWLIAAALSATCCIVAVSSSVNADNPVTLSLDVLILPITFPTTSSIFSVFSVRSLNISCNFDKNTLIPSHRLAISSSDTTVILLVRSPFLCSRSVTICAISFSARVIGFRIRFSTEYNAPSIARIPTRIAIPFRITALRYTRFKPVLSAATFFSVFPIRVVIAFCIFSP